jgi:hypothetical protein
MNEAKWEYCSRGSLETLDRTGDVTSCCLRSSTRLSPLSINIERHTERGSAFRVIIKDGKILMTVKRCGPNEENGNVPCSVPKQSNK